MNPLLPFLMLLVSWSVDFTDPDMQQIVMYVFIAAHVIIFGVMVYIFVCVWTKNDTRTLRVNDQFTNEMQEMTTAGYDLSKWRELFFTKLSLPVAVGLFVASRWNTPFPLLIQCVKNPQTLYESPLFQLYLLGKPEEGAFVRPWKNDSVMPEWMQNMWERAQPDDDAAAQGGAKNLKKKRKSSTTG